MITLPNRSVDDIKGKMSFFRKNRGALLFLLLFLTTLVHGQMQGKLSSFSPFTRIKIDSRIEGLRLSLLSTSARSYEVKKPPVLLVHGASFPSELAFGFRMEGYSWMDRLSENGFDVYALDFLGYGDSDNYAEMMKPGLSKEPLGLAKEVVLDIEKAVRYILNQTSFDKIHLIGHSWGGTVAGYYSTLHPEQINKLVLFAPFAEREGPTNWAELDYAFIDLSPEDRIKQFLTGLPAGEEVVLESDVLNRWGSEWLESDITSVLRNSNSVRYPSGWEKDLFDCWNGACIFSPQQLLVPTLLIRGEWDAALTFADAEKLFKNLENVSQKRYVILEKSTHVAHLEKKREQLYAEVNLFLNEGVKEKRQDMIAVIFEVLPNPANKQEYLDIAARLRQDLNKIDGFISIERFVSLQNSGKILSLSYWRNESAISEWRNLQNHRDAQKKGRRFIFENYRLRVAQVLRDYGMHERQETPDDSKKLHDN